MVRVVRFWMLVASYVIGRPGVASGGCGSLMLAGSCWSAGVARSWRGDGRVADGGGVVDPEYRGEVQRVGAAGEGFVELPVDPEALEGGGQSAAGFGQPVLADGP